MRDKKLIYQAGMTMVELIAAMLISSILISSVYFLLKSFKQNSNQIKQEIDTQILTTNFISVFSNEIASAGYQPIDSLLQTSIFTPEVSNPAQVVNVTFSQNYSINTITVRYDVSRTTRQVITYRIGTLNRSSLRPNEKVIYKSKMQYSNYPLNRFQSTSVFNDQIALSGIEDFECIPSINPSPVNANGSIRGLNCILSMYTSTETTISNSSASKVRTYQFYAKANNLF
jgi:prepilin-type N-terminal cleavage/methylation domain-containing protein